MNVAAGRVPVNLFKGAQPDLRHINSPKALENKTAVNTICHWVGAESQLVIGAVLLSMVSYRCRCEHEARPLLQDLKKNYLHYASCVVKLLRT